MIKSDYSVNKMGKFLTRRFIRLEPPYIAAICIGLLYFWIRRFIPGSSSEEKMLTPYEIYLHIGYLVPFKEGARWAVPSLWTLSIEFQYYLLLSLTFPLAMKDLRWRIVFYCLFLILPFLGISGEFFPFHAALFLLGIAYALWHAQVIRNKEYLTLIIAASIVGYITLEWTQLFIGLITIGIIHFATNFQNRTLSFLGAISYSLYLTHQSTGTAVINFLSHRFRETYQKPIVMILGFLVTIACAYLLYKLIELPSLKWSKKLTYKKMATSNSLS